MHRDTALEIIREKGIKPGEMVMVQWFFVESGATEALEGLAEEGILERKGPRVAGVQAKYILKIPV